MLPASVLRVADAYWAQDFGCVPEELRKPAQGPESHTGRLFGNPGMWALVFGDVVRISLPARWLELLRARAAAWTREVLFQPELLAAELVPLRMSRFVGPAFIGYLSHAPLLRPAGSVRRLGAGDGASVERLRARLNVREWEHGGSSLDGPCFGRFDRQGNLTALAGYEVWDAAIAHIAVVTLPEHRGRGHGAAVVCAAAEQAVQDRLVPQYRTLLSNRAALGVASRLGFIEYGCSVYVDLQAGKGRPAGGVQSS
jgi:GNAT superfamily N-acetyltransferase